MVGKQVLDDFVRQTRIVSQAQQLKGLRRLQEHAFVAESSHRHLMPALVLDTELLCQVPGGLLLEVPHHLLVSECGTLWLELVQVFRRRGYGVDFGFGFFRVLDFSYPARFNCFNFCHLIVALIFDQRRVNLVHKFG